MIFRGIFRHRATMAGRRKANYNFDNFNIMVAVFSTIFFVSAVSIIYFFGETFITLSDLFVKYVFISLVSLFLSFFYARYRNDLFYPFILPVSFVVAAPLLLVFFLVFNFYFSEPYATFNYRIPEDFRVESDSRTMVMVPVYDESIKAIPNYQQLRFTRDKIKLSESEMIITINYGCFGYYVVRKIEYL